MAGRRRLGPVPTPNGVTGTWGIVRSQEKRETTFSTTSF